MFCCPNCFSDSFLHEHIVVSSQNNGTCSFCKSKRIEVVAPNSLNDIFAPILDIYETSTDGMSLGKCIQSDWNSFSNYNEVIVNKLLIEITQDSSLGSTKFRSRIEIDKSKLELWRDFREELKHQNRYFPQLIPDIENLRKLFVLLTLPIGDLPALHYRARIHTSSTPFLIKDMGMPPKINAIDGRANPKGIPYLYTASNVVTALSEVRPFKGDEVTVVGLEVQEPMPLVDLRNPRQTISPFELEDDDLSQIYENMPFLILLGDELSKPVIPRSADLEYLPSQYLCEFVKHIEFEGIVYRSSLADGNNYAFFSEEKLERVSTKHYIIDDTDIKFSEIIQS